MEDKKEQTDVSETKDKETKEKTEKEESSSPLIGGEGLLQLIHDTVGRITDILQSVSEELKSEDKSDEDVVEFAKDDDEPKGLKETVEEFSPELAATMPHLPVDGCGGEQQKSCDEALKFPDISEALGGDNVAPFSMEVLNDNDFNDADPVVNTFKNDMGGCGGMIKILRISDRKQALVKLSEMYHRLNQIRIANKANALKEIFEHINAAAAGLGAKHQLLAVKKIDTYVKTASSKEQAELMKAKDAVLQGTAQHFDAAGYRVRGVFSQYVPEQMVRTAYTNLETQNGTLIMLPQGKHQIGHPTTLELSKFRDQSVDAKIDPNTGEVKNGYIGFEQRRDNMEAARNRFETHRNPVNDESLLTLAKGERSKPLTKNERNYEQRLDEDTKGRYDDKNWDKSREEALNDTPEAYLGHHGDPKEDESIAHTLSKTASKGYDKIDPKSEDTFGTQLSAGHDPVKDDMTWEQMLEDEHVGLTDEELDMLLEEWLESSREDKD